MALSRYPTIPDFSDTPESIGRAVRSVKESVEQLTGQRQGDSYGAPAIYVGPVAPSMENKLLYKIGDQWINELTDQMSYWNGSSWRLLA